MMEYFRVYFGGLAMNQSASFVVAGALFACMSTSYPANGTRRRGLAMMEYFRVYFGGLAMNQSASFVVAGALFACMSTSYAANGTCNITPDQVRSLTFGGAASGQALRGNALGIPSGAFSRVAVAKATMADYDRGGKQIVGTWSETIVTNDSLGHLTTSTFPGTFAVNTQDCTAQFSYNAYGGVVFTGVFVGQGTELQGIVTVPGIILSFTVNKL